MAIFIECDNGSWNVTLMNTLSSYLTMDDLRNVMKENTKNNNVGIHC